MFERIPEPYVDNNHFQRIHLTTCEDEQDSENNEVCEGIVNCISLREKWMRINAVQIPETAHDCEKETPLTPGSKQQLRHREDLPYNIFDTQVMNIRMNECNRIMPQLILGSKWHEPSV